MAAMEGSRIASQAQRDCRYFSGYKPCGKNDICSSRCPFKEVAEPRVLIVHLEALGAVLRTTALLRSIKKKWPQAHISWVTSPAAAPLLENNPFVDRIVRNSHEGILVLSSLQFDYTFVVDKSAEATGLVDLTVDPGEVRGFAIEAKTGAVVPLNPEAARLYELGISNHEKFFVNNKPEAQLIVEAMGLEYDKPTDNEGYVFEFSDSEKSFRDSERNRFALAEGVPVIGLNTGCSSVIPYKKFSVKGWLQLIRTLHAKFPEATLMLLGGPEDTERNNEIQDSLEFNVINTPTTSGLRKGLVYVDLCDVVVTGDSLGMHMGIALKKWIVAWFGPTCAQEIDFYGRGTAIKTSAPCSPCWKRSCDKEVMCYDQVEWAKVTQGVKLGLSKLGLQTSTKILAPSTKILASRP